MPAEANRAWRRHRSRSWLLLQGRASSARDEHVTSAGALRGWTGSFLRLDLPSMRAKAGAQGEAFQGAPVLSAVGYGGRWALTDVSFEIPEGALVMLTGRNGSGKSTLLRVLATAIRADRGTVRVLGHDVRVDRDQARRNIALLGHRTHL